MSEQVKKQFTAVFYFSDEEKAICPIYGTSIEQIGLIIHQAAGGFLEVPSLSAEFESINLALVKRFKIHAD